MSHLSGMIRSGTLPVHCNLHIYENVACETMCYLTRIRESPRLKRSARVIPSLPDAIFCREEPSKALQTKDLDGFE
ncbi:hypothetical protein MY11210_007418 [Beauveria gryllotalpidicola]